MTGVGAGVVRRVVRWLGVFGLLAVSTACYTYVPVATPAPGTTVRVHVPVTSAAIGPNAAPQSIAIEGEVVAFRDTLFLATESRQVYGAYREVTMVDTLSFAPGERLAVEQAEFSRGRTAALSVAVVGGITLLAIAAFHGVVGGDPPTDPPPPNPQGAIVVSNSFVSGVLGLLGLAH